MDENEKALAKANKARSDVLGHANKRLEGVNAKMEARVTKIAEENGVSLAKAMDIAVNDPEYQALYLQHGQIQEGVEQALQVLG